MLWAYEEIFSQISFFMILLINVFVCYQKHPWLTSATLSTMFQKQSFHLNWADIQKGSVKRGPKLEPVKRQIFWGVINQVMIKRSNIKGLIKLKGIWRPKAISLRQPNSWESPVHGLLSHETKHSCKYSLKTPWKTWKLIKNYSPCFHQSIISYVIQKSACSPL